MMASIPALNAEINIYVVPFMVAIVFLLFASVASIMVWGHAASFRQALNSFSKVIQEALLLK